jgi:DNA-binding PadR family transcriptional regulator
VSVSHVVLRYLREGPAHGYGLHKQITQLRHYYPLSNVNIYAVLRELEDLGWAESVSQIHGSRMRRVYRMTDAGGKELSNWLGRPPEDDRHIAKDPIALKLLMLSADEPIDMSWWGDCGRVIDEEIALTRECLDLPKDRSPRGVRTLLWQRDAYLRRRGFLVEAIRIGEARREVDEAGVARNTALG